MTDIITLMLEKTAGTIKGGSLEDIAREQKLIGFRSQLARFTELEGTLGFIGRDLHKLARNGMPDLVDVKPLQEQARVATSPIRGHIYIIEQREKIEQAAWTVIGAKINTPAHPNDIMKESRKNKSGYDAPAVQVEASDSINHSGAITSNADPAEKPQEGASLHRLQKNLKSRVTARKKGPKNKSDPLADLEAELKEAEALLKPAKQKLLDSTSTPAVIENAVLKAAGK